MCKDDDDEYQEVPRIPTIERQDRTGTAIAETGQKDILIDGV